MDGQQGERWLAALAESLRGLPAAPLGKEDAAALRRRLAREARRDRSLAQALAAYADGELSAAQRRFVEERLLPLAKCRQWRDETLAMRGALQTLASAAAPADALPRTLAALAGEIPRSDPREELSAGLDGEADPAAAARVKALLRKSPVARQLARDWRRTGAALAALPAAAAPPDFAACLAAALPTAEFPVPAPSVLAPAPPPRRWHAFAWATALGLSGLAFWLSFAPPRNAAPLAANSAPIPPAGVAGAARSAAPPGFAGVSAPAPGANVPLVDDEPAAPRELAGPPDPALGKKLDDMLRPGQVVGGGRVEFVCLNVERMHDRVRALFLRHQVAVRSDGPAQDADGELLRIEIEATPEQLQQLLTGLRHAEERDHLVAGLEVRKPAAPAARAAAAVETPRIAANVTIGSTAAAKAEPKTPPAVAVVPPPPPAEPPLPADAPRRVLFVLRSAPASVPGPMPN